MVSYQMAQKRRVRITLDMEVLGDFNPREIDFEKVFKLEPSEKVEAYIEDMDIDWWEHTLLMRQESVWEVPRIASKGTLTLSGVDCT